MLLRHATFASNLPSIGKLGLLTSFSKGKLPVVWLHCPTKSAWAACHVVKRHGGQVEDVIVLEIEIPRGWLRRNRRGLWYCPRDVPPGRFRGLISFTMLARSPVDDAAPVGC